MVLVVKMGPSSSASTVTTPLFFLVVAGGSAAVAASFVGYQWHCRTVNRLSQKLEEWEERRREERTGRIRAEVKLRTMCKEKEALQVELLSKTAASSGGDSSTMKDNNNDDKNKMILNCIGTVLSPYTKRMGTPRQGSLVPSSRAFIELTIPTEALDGIEMYSHIWIIFAFHANTNVFHKKTKVRPPRAAGNKKVGQLATRSPHRPNPLGLSLVKMERLDAKLKRLHISGLDLVNGTPVYDIKPCVPWDIPGYDHNSDNNNTTTMMEAMRVPDWVDQKDVLETVQFTEPARVALRQMVEEGRLAPLYTSGNDGIEAAQATLTEVLAQDPRSSHKGLKVNQRGSNSANSREENKTNNQLYSLVFGKVMVEFQVASWGVQVVNVVAVDFDEDAYVEGIPLISEQKSKTK